jgi:hypothetical protein
VAGRLGFLAHFPDTRKFNLTRHLLLLMGDDYTARDEIIENAGLGIAKL